MDVPNRWSAFSIPVEKLPSPRKKDSLLRIPYDIQKRLSIAIASAFVALALLLCIQPHFIMCKRKETEEISITKLITWLVIVVVVVLTREKWMRLFAGGDAPRERSCAGVAGASHDVVG